MVINVNIHVNIVSELRDVLKEWNTNEGNEDDAATGGILEKAKAIAEDCVEQFVPFTYDDVGLPIEKRNYRAPFRAWAESNNIEYKHVKGPGKSGSQGKIFYPFYLDESGQEVLATFPKEEIKN